MRIPYFGWQMRTFDSQKIDHCSKLLGLKRYFSCPASISRHSAKLTDPGFAANQRDSRTAALTLNQKCRSAKPLDRTLAPNHLENLEHRRTHRLSSQSGSCRIDQQARLYACLVGKRPQNRFT